MKKFYTLLAAAAVTVSAGVAQKLLPVAPVGFNSSLAALKAEVSAQPFDFSAPSLRSLPDYKEGVVPGTYYCYFNYYDKNGNEYTEASSFSIVAGTQPNTYVLKDFLASALGVQTKDINATLGTATDKDGEYYQLTIPGGQDLLTNQGRTYKLYPGCDSATGGGYDLNSDITFKLYNVGFAPDYSFNGQSGESIPGGVAYLYVEGEDVYGGVLGNTILYAANGELNTTVTTDGQTGTEVKADVLGIKSSKRGRTYLTIYGMTDGANEFGALELNCDVATGVMSGTDQLAGVYYTDESYTETFNVYYFNGDASSVMTVNANGRLQDGKTYVSFGEDLMLWASVGDDSGWMRLFVEPVINFNCDLGVCTNTAIENVAADVVDANVPVEFFNIQGQRIDNPANGQLVIRRQGSKVEKLIVR